MASSSASSSSGSLFQQFAWLEGGSSQRPDGGWPSPSCGGGAASTSGSLIVGGVAGGRSAPHPDSTTIASPTTPHDKHDPRHAVLTPICPVPAGHEPYASTRDPCLETVSLSR